jgi:lambda family phage portal protein
LTTDTYIVGTGVTHVAGTQNHDQNAVLRERNKLLRHRVSAMAAGNGYDAAKSDRLNRERSTFGGNGNEHLDAEALWELREKCRDLDRNSGLAIGVLDRITENVLGPSGFDLLPKTGRNKKGLNERIVDDWNDWLERYADSRGEFHGWELFQRSYRQADVDGDFFYQLDPNDWDGEGSIRGFEADRVLSPFDYSSSEARAVVDGQPLINGVARTKKGEVAWYFVTDESPSTYHVRRDEGQLIRAADVVHIYDPRRHSQNRSEPRLAPVIRDLDDLDDLLMYERVAAKVLAAQAYIVKSATPDAMADAMHSADDSSGGNRTQEVVPGLINYIGHDDEFASAPGNRPGNNFGEFVRLLNRYVGLPIGLPVELILLDFSEVNFASSRQLLNQAQRRFKREQVRIGRHISRVYRWWLSRRVARGVYDRGNAKAIESGAIFRHEWGFPGWPSPNPLQDAQASAVALEWEFGSRTNINRAHGVKQDDIFDDLDRERDRVVTVPKNVQVTDTEGSDDE